MFAEVWAFALTGGPSKWSGPLVLRLYPADADHEQLHVEAAVQNGLAAGGFPAPEILLVDDTDGTLGRRFIVMERMPGRPRCGACDGTYS